MYQTSFNFDQVKTYSIYQRDSSFTDTQSLLDSKRNSIEIAIEKSLDKNGFSYRQSDTADLIVTYHFLQGKKEDYHDYNREVLFCDLCLKASNWYSEGSPLKIEQGSLIIDLIDTKRKRSVWRNIAPLKLKNKDNAQITQNKIQQIIESMFQQYPRFTPKL